VIKVTAPEFTTIHDGIAAAHLYLQAVTLLVRRHARQLPTNARKLIDDTPELIRKAFFMCAAVVQREEAKNPAAQIIATATLNQIDTKTMRNELENISALVMPDIDYEMRCAMVELPGLDSIIASSELEAVRVSRVMAIAWEAGRRYGLMQAIAIFADTSIEYQRSHETILEAALNCTLELPGPGEQPAGGTLIDFSTATAQPQASDGIDNTEDSGDQDNRRVRIERVQ
jgi:hypothetical protein